jgi:hypothetical protein
MRLCVTGILTVFLMLSSGMVQAQSQEQSWFSEPLKLPEDGWNKVLVAPNGNTLLFHFLQKEAIQVFVFDSKGNTVAAREYPGKDFNVNFIRETRCLGLFIVDGEAVVFLSQEWYGKQSIFRLRFSLQNGKLVDETRLETAAQGAVQQHDSGYVLLSVRNPKTPDGSDDIQAVFYDTHHKELRRVAMGWGNRADLKDLMFVRVVLLSVHSSRSGGLFFTITGSGGKAGRLEGATTRFSHKHVIDVRLDWQDTVFTYRITPMQEDIYPQYNLTAWDSVSNTDRQMFVTSTDVTLREADGNRDVPFYHSNYIVRRHEDLSSLGRRLYMPEDTTVFKTAADHEVMRGLPMHMRLCENGSAVLFSEDYDSKSRVALGYRYTNTVLGPIYIRGVSGNGRKSWEVAIPKIQYTPGMLRPTYFADANWIKYIGSGHDPVESFYYRLASFGVEKTGAQDWSLVFNEPKRSKAGSEDQALYDLRTATAVLCTVKEDGTFEKKPLYDAPSSGVTPLASVIESGCFDTGRGVYASLVLCQKGATGRELRMAWSRVSASPTQ